MLVNRSIGGCARNCYHALSKTGVAVICCAIEGKVNMSEAISTGQIPAQEHRLSWSVITSYSAPGVGAGYMYLLLSLYIMKFSTDVLLIAPAVMGTIFGISRVWDAVSDPLVGYLSDRTKHPLGRRRLWLLLSIGPGTYTQLS